MRLKRLALFVFVAACSHGQTGTVAFGAAGPFSRAYGLANKQGIQLALDEINGSAAWAGGRRLEIRFADDSGNGARASTIAQGFVDDPNIVAVVGHVNSLGISAETVRWGWSVAARAAHSLGDSAALAKLVDILDEHPMGKLPLVLRAERDLVRAQLAARSDTSEAAALFDRALAAFRRIPARYHLAHALLDYAEFLAGSGDSMNAELAITEAAQIAEQLGARPLAQRAAAVRGKTARSHVAAD